MKRIKNLLLIFIVNAILVSCNINKSNVPGVYIAKNLINNIDTLKIYENGTYEKVLYRKKDKRLLYKNYGKWEFEKEEERIILYDFYVDEDTNYSDGASCFDESLITLDVEMEILFNKTIIRYMMLSEYKYYEKY